MNYFTDTLTDRWADVTMYSPGAGTVTVAECRQEATGVPAGVITRNGFYDSISRFEPTVRTERAVSEYGASIPDCDSPAAV